MRIRKNVRSMVVTGGLFGLALITGVIAPITTVINAGRASALTSWEESGWSQVAEGASHSCGISEGDGHVYCWGSTSNGTLGNGVVSGRFDQPVPVDTSGVLNNKVATAITSGSNHTCIIAGGQAYCWGVNGYGQLGDGADEDSSVPVAVDTNGVLAGKTLQSIASGNDHTCAIDTAGRAYCWGMSYGYRLGTTNFVSTTNVPVAVDTSGVLAGKTLQSIRAGFNHTCAIDTAGQAYCWGNNNYGILGNNPSQAELDQGGSPPVAVDTSTTLAGKTVLSIAMGDVYTCVIASDHKAYCWGYNFGEFGDGTTTSSMIPVAAATDGVLAGKELVSIAARGGGHVCALDTDGRAYCWGANNYGQLGNGTMLMSDVPTAVDVSGALAGKALQSIVAGMTHTCAVATDHSAYCWGYNATGAIGSGGYENVTYVIQPLKVGVPDPSIGSYSPLQRLRVGDSRQARLYGNSFLDGAKVFVGDQEVVVSSITTFMIMYTIPSSSTPGAKDLKVVNPNGGTSIQTGAVTYFTADAPNVTNVEVAQQGQKTLTIRGTGFLYDPEDMYSFEAGYDRSLVSLNGTPLSYCIQTTGYTLEDEQSWLDDPSVVTDTPPCYYLYDTDYNGLITYTQAVVLLPDDFDTTGEGTVSVNGSPAFTFNQPTGQPGEQPAPATQPTPVTVTTPAAPVVSAEAREVRQERRAASVGVSAPVTDTTAAQDSSATPIFKMDGQSPASQVTLSAHPTFTGKARPGSKVTVTVHSDPVTCTTTADANGDWSCTLSEDLPKGSHSVYLAVVTPDNQTSSYGPYAITVADSTKDSATLSGTNGVAVTQEGWPWFVYGLVALGLLGGVAALVVVFRKRRH